MDLEFTGEVVEWRGPAPHHFVALPEAEARVHEVARLATYGWGCIPVAGRLGGSDFTTSLFPKDGGYLLPLKLAVRRREGVELGDVVTVSVSLGV
ncbi:DUF1905 domain-containing protein [Phycicoccus sp. MAQZ13P-2]|uniref:DUF1905 domain-containing protein n=1 Tax=Phycicoccus mangrovi TaxID=2840470 RepID=UPI001C000EF5|nr:DUF1905 domain-containing protein [Phycicoccus mangrovi]MBT9258048.1 DUF1905 domain-containing protein [Phycicoccus mangrovi]MBT9276259.1 DUF1905 domain-containing protein [Phycicoccus mangrovi]